MYISTISVYSNEGCISNDKLNDESNPLYDVTQPGAAKSAYQFNKRSAEIAIEESGLAYLSMRSGIILGPHEATIIELGRLTWWLTRLQKAGKVLAPGPREMGMQLVDVRDLANFTLDAIEKKLEGAYNIVDEVGKVTIGDFLDTGNRVVGNGAELVWKGPEELKEVKAFNELPLWVDWEEPMYKVVYRTDTRKAREAGLKCRGLEECVGDTWSWMTEGELRPVPAPGDYKGFKLGIDSDKEKRLLGE